MHITDPQLPVKDRIKMLDKRESKILDDIKNLDFNLRSTQNKIQDIFLDWALVIEEQHILGSYVKPVNTICSRIIQILKENSLDELTKYTYSLPDKYKQMKYQHAGLYGSAHRNTPFKFADSIVQDELDNYRELEKEEYVKAMLTDERKYSVYLPSNIPIEGLTKEEIRKKYDIIKETKSRLRDEQNQLEDIIKENNIALVGEELEKHESTEKPEAKVTVFYTAIDDSVQSLTRLVNTLEQLKEKVKQFPPEEEDAPKYAKAYGDFMTELVDGINEFIKPIKDEKWTQSWPEWFKTALLEVYHGKHAAAKMSAALSFKGVFRPLTREQVGDTKERVFEQALDYVKNVAMYDLLTDYHNKYIRPRILDRKLRLSPKLSDNA